MAWKILHIGDIHVRTGEHLSDIEEVFVFLLDLILERQPDLILIPGDVFESKSSPAEREVFREWLSNLRTVSSAPVVIAKGNHDAPQDLLVWGMAEDVHVFERPELITFGRFDKANTLWPIPQDDIEAAKDVHPDFDGIGVLVVPWPEKSHLAARGITGEANEEAGGAALAQMIQLMATEHDSDVGPLVGMGHLSVTGAATSSGQPMIGREIQIGAGSLADTGAAYWALSHIHKHQEMTPGVVYAGSLTGHDHGESEKKGVVFVEVSDGAASWEFVPVPARRWETIEATVEDQGILEMRGDVDILHDTAEQPWCQDWNIRYRYHCTAEQALLFDHSEIERRFAVAHTLKIVPDIERTERVRAAEVAEAKTPAEKLRAWGDATETKIPESAVEKLGELQEAI